MNEAVKRKLAKLSPKQKEELEFLLSYQKILKSQIEQRSFSNF